MDFSPALIPATLLKRYKRFLADVKLDSGEEITAHCPNPGAMVGITQPDSRIWLSHVDDPKRKLKYTWQMIEAEGEMIGMNTMNPNRLVKEALENQHFPEFAQYTDIRPEKKYGTNSRIDFYLSARGEVPCYLEVKNVHLVRTQGLAEFPDCVTARGAKHLLELAEVAREGNRAVVMYVVQRKKCETFTTAADYDPQYAKNTAIAREAGVEFMAYNCDVSPASITIADPLRVI